MPGIGIGIGYGIEIGTGIGIEIRTVKCGVPILRLVKPTPTMQVFGMTEEGLGQL